MGGDDTNDDIRSIPALISCIKFAWNKLFSADSAKTLCYSSHELDKLVDHDRGICRSDEDTVIGADPDNIDVSTPIIPEKELEIMVAASRIFKDAYAFKKRESIPTQKFYTEIAQNGSTVNEKSIVSSKKKRQNQTCSVDKKDIICQVWYGTNFILLHYI